MSVGAGSSPLSLERALERLLFSRSYRAAFLAGATSSLAVAPEDLEALLAIDREQLVRAAETVRRDVWRRAHRGSGSLAELYPATVAAWRAAHPDDGDLRELVFAFMESSAFADHRELPFAGEGASLEEAFYRFCETEGIGDATAREGEFLAASIKALAMSPRAAFRVPAEVRSVPHGFFAVATRGVPTLHAAVRGRYLTGPLTPFLSELLLAAHPAAEIAARHGVGRPVLQEALRRLDELGLAPIAPDLTGEADAERESPRAAAST